MLATRRYPLAQVTYGQDEIDAVLEALNAGQTTCGPRVKQFEESFARYVGRNFAIMVNSGSSADLLVAYGLGAPSSPDEEVLIPAVTWPTQVWSAVQAGYTVRLVDVDPETLQFDGWDLVQKINDQTQAAFPVHVLGNVGEMERLIDIEIPLIEDCCEALGSRYKGQHVGTFGQAAAFSFFFSHLINTMEGGMVVCDQPEDERLYRLWRTHGWEPEPDCYFSFSTWGFNLRPTELQGAFGNVQMTKLEQFKRARQINYNRLADWTSNEFLRAIKVLPECEPAWHGFPLMIAEDAPFTKVALCKWLELHGIESRPIIAGNIARQKAVQDSDRVISGPLPGADQVHNRGLYLGLSSFDDPEGCGYVAETIAEFLRGY
jgi:CDP-4-dehydro-6-deoxyglucose reductase, E1